MEWAPKFLDNLDSSVMALYQSWAGYYRWVFLRLVMTIVAVASMVMSPTIRILAIAVVTTYATAEIVGRLFVRRKKGGFTAAGGQPL